MRISGIAVTETPSYFEVSARVCADACRADSLNAWFRMEKLFGPPRPWGDVFAAGFIVTAMFTGENLHIEGAISGDVRAALQTCQALQVEWYPEMLRRVTITADEVTRLPPVPPASEGVRGSFFSGGVDSWYTFLTERDAISHLLMIRGFDARIDNEGAWKHARNLLERTAARYGKTPLFMETNMPALGDVRSPLWSCAYFGGFWAEMQFGSLLAAAGYALYPNIPRILVPQAFSFPGTDPHGGHPDLFRLWSTEMLSFLAHGTDVFRVDKARLACSDDLALKDLRVCTKSLPTGINCCRCEKCLRTMLTLAAFGVLDRAETFPYPLEPACVKRLPMMPQALPEYPRVIRELEARGEMALAEALRIAQGERFDLGRFLWTVRVRCGEWIRRLARRIVRGRKTWKPAHSSLPPRSSPE